MDAISPPFKKPGGLAIQLVNVLTEQIRSGRLNAGDKLPTEAAIMKDFGVSRTVVREAISRLQASGWVDTRHGIGTFVLPKSDHPSFRISPEHMGTLREVIALLEFRISVETEAAALAALRRRPENLQELRAALQAFNHAIEEDRDAVAADHQFHQEIARATQNHHFVDLMHSLGAGVIPRARISSILTTDPERQNYLRRVNQEHESIFNAIAEQDVEAARAAMRIHLANSRERLRKSDPDSL
ncbi:MAG: FadR family transcriptional regulator [Limnohabitans sp.]|jgi:GntR family transcriptional regulator, transcriptional repressor for pyruvate dehydrogenase complex|nr:FadR family transcriptional regulator [Limnohabitans sp.]MDP4773000.1 FadR family transcriptional regulator [Limnohabitans sp.]MDP4923440.1 FadR family transcriptional regulator [Limnohabitans sp.]